MPITLDRRPKNRYPFGIFHTSLGSTLCTDAELKSDLTVGVLSSLGQSKSSGEGIVIPYKELYETFFLYSLIEKRMLYFSMLFHHTSTNIIIIKFRQRAVYNDMSR
jgi:hypothetical protein